MPKIKHIESNLDTQIHLTLMIIIADSGSTKCDWKLVDSSGIKQHFSTKGYNPFFYTSEVIYKELQPVFSNIEMAKTVKKVVFYGAGCSDDFHSGIVKDGLQQVFQASEIEVQHDLLAAARATCGTKAGLACIIGTGSNSCLYDGKNVIDNVSNLGYLMGDEGSGSHLGKALIRAYAYREMPADLMRRFEQKYNFTNIRQIVKTVYESSTPNVYLASLSRFYSENSTHEFIQQLVAKSFRAFTQRHLLKYQSAQNLPAHFVGSIAYYFKDILKFVLQSEGIELGLIIKQPIDNLVEYHQINDTIYSG